MSEESQDLENKLAELAIFAGLSRRQVKKLVGKAKKTEHQAGHEVASEGAGALALHLILSGDALVTARGVTIRELHPGDYFGEISMIDGKRRSATVTATTTLQTLAVQHVVFQQLLESEPEFASALLLVLCARLREAEGA